MFLRSSTFGVTITKFNRELVDLATLHTTWMFRINSKRKSNIRVNQQKQIRFSWDIGIAYLNSALISLFSIISVLFLHPSRQHWSSDWRCANERFFSSPTARGSSSGGENFHSSVFSRGTFSIHPFSSDSLSRTLHSSPPRRRKSQQLQRRGSVPSSSQSFFLPIHSRIPMARSLARQVPLLGRTRLLEPCGGEEPIQLVAYRRDGRTET